jgi:hypothetical protein
MHKLGCPRRVSKVTDVLGGKVGRSPVISAENDGERRKSAVRTPFWRLNINDGATGLIFPIDLRLLQLVGIVDVN